MKALLKRDIQIDLLFVDPPYHKKDYYDLVETLVQGEKITANATIVCEHSTEIQLPSNYGAFVCTRQETYGSTIVSIYRRQEEEGESVV